MIARWCSTWLYIIGGLLLITTDSSIWILAFLSAHTILLILSIGLKDFRLKLQYTFLMIVDFFIIIHLFFNNKIFI